MRYIPTRTTIVLKHKIKSRILGIALLFLVVMLAFSRISTDAHSSTTEANAAVESFPTKTATASHINPLGGSAASCPTPAPSYVVVGPGDVAGLYAAAQAGSLAYQCQPNQQFTIYLTNSNYVLSSTLNLQGNIVLNGADSTIQGSNIELVSVYEYVTIRHVIFQNGNTPADILGGALGGSGELTIEDSQFTNNSSNTNGFAGAGGAISFGGYFDFERVTFNQNMAIGSGSVGGAVAIHFITNSAQTNKISQIRCSLFFDNQSNQGGAIVFDNGAPNTTLAYINDNTFQDNSAVAADGSGDIYSRRSSSLMDVTHNFWAGNTPQVVSDDPNPIGTSPVLPTDPTVPIQGVYNPPDCQPVPPVNPPNSTPTTTSTPTNTPTNTATNTATPSATTIPTNTATLTPVPVTYNESIGAYDPTTAHFYLRNSNTSGAADITVTFGTPNASQVPVVGDWNGAGIDTIGVFDPATGQFFLRYSNTTGYSDINFAFGNTNTPYYAVAGHWNGSATHDGVGLYNQSNGVLYLKNNLSTGAADYTIVSGLMGSIPVAGGWAGDNVDGVGFYLPAQTSGSNSQPLANINYDLTNSICVYCTPGYTYQFSQSFSSSKPQNTLAIAGDWHGTGSAGTGIYDPATGLFSVKDTLSSGAGGSPFVFGNPGWIPLAGHWNQQGPIPTNTPHPTPTDLPTNTATLGLVPTNTPMVFPCQVTLINPATPVRGPSPDDVPTNQTSLASGTQLTTIVSAIDELGTRWYGFNSVEQFTGQSIVSWIPSTQNGRIIIDEQPNWGCLSALPDESVKLPVPTTAADSWSVYLGTAVPQLPIMPANLATPNPSFRGFGVVSSDDYSAISGCRHPGFDFFTIGSASVLSISDGLVVGIGTSDDYAKRFRPGAWGSVTGVSVVNPHEYNLVIRSGAHFVLYGHLHDVAPSLHDGIQVHAGDIIGTVDVQNNNNTHLHVEIDAFDVAANAEGSLRFSYGAIKRSGITNPNLVTDLTYFLPASAQGVPTYSAPPVPVCTGTPGQIITPASNTRYVGAQMNGIAGNITLVYAARDGEHNACFKTSPGQVPPNLTASQCSSFPLPTPTPGKSVTPTLVP